tara:strand:- start:60 stop:344 length:285 start_codon:yes stop_codon:yes gene_type:complete
MTILLYSRRNEWPVESVTIECSYRRVKNSEPPTGGSNIGPIEEIHSKITLNGDLSNDQRDRLAYIAGKCPIQRTLESNPRMIKEIKVVQTEESK